MQRSRCGLYFSNHICYNFKFKEVVKMEEKRLNRRSFLKYAGVGSLAALSLVVGGTRTARAGVGDALELLGKIPEEVLNRLPEVLHEINSNQDRYMGLFMTDPRSLLRNEFGIDLPFTKFQIIAFDLSTEETEWFKVIADPSYPYESEIPLSPATLGFVEGRVGLVLRSRY
jgi:hypothetical protein